MASFYIPLSGLNADSTALNTIANDLSNMNTTAFKSQTTNFSDLFYQQVAMTGSGNAIQVGGGTQVSANATDFAQGSIDSTGVATNAALNGNGFFILNDGGIFALTRAGDFSLASNGDLVTSDGLNVMGFPATSGVVNMNAPLTAINIPENQAQPPLATTIFGMTANLDSAAAVGTTVPATVKVYDSLNNSYEATVTYTKTGLNVWSYSVTLPDTLTAAPATAPAAATLPVPAPSPIPTSVTIAATAVAPAPASFTTALTPSSTVAGTNTTYSYNFGTGGTVDPTTSLTIGGTDVVVASVESVSALQAQIAGLDIAGVTASVNGNVLTITAPTATAVSGSLVGNLSGTTNDFTFNDGSTVDPATNLTITGQTATGASATITAPAVTAGETITAYANALTSSLSAAGITNVTVNSATGQLSIVGANISTNGSVSQDLSDTAIDYDFGYHSTANPTTNLTITGPASAGGTATTALPTVTAGETVAEYAAALSSALTTAGIDTGPGGVSVTATGGQLSILGPKATLTTAGTASQDLSASNIVYSFGSSNGTVATVDPSTNLTITGLTSTGATATITAPTVTSGESVAQYATALTSALAQAGISGVSVSSASGTLTITGANVTTSGNVVQDPVASANATGTLTFDSSGNLVSPAGNVSDVSFSGLSDGAATMNMTWDLLGANGSPTISQIDSTSGVSATTQNGYASGNYQSFSIGSDGTITATYSNGQNQTIGQLALANVANLQGLQALGNSEYATTLASGTASIGTSGTDGLGTVTGEALEQSNVSISTEFSDLIIAQRAFEANAKAVTTFDTLTQETINMIH